MRFAGRTRQQYFNAIGLGYSCNLSDTVKYYKMYRDFMAFWDYRLPEVYLRLDYDLLVSQTENVSKPLMQYISLPWDESCLTVNRTIRLKQPLVYKLDGYYLAAEEWRKYSNYLLEVSVTALAL